MKAELTVFSNCIPEVSREGALLKMDFGTVVLELTATEAHSLCTALMAVAPVVAQMIAQDLGRRASGG